MLTDPATPLINPVSLPLSLPQPHSINSRLLYSDQDYQGQIPLIFQASSTRFTARM